MPARHGVWRRAPPPRPRPGAKLQPPLPAGASRASSPVSPWWRPRSGQGPSSGWGEQFPQPWHRLARPIAGPVTRKGGRFQEAAAVAARLEGASSRRTARRQRPSQVICLGTRGHGKGSTRRPEAECHRTQRGAALLPHRRGSQPQPRGPSSARASGCPELLGAGRGAAGRGRRAWKRQT